MDISKASSLGDVGEVEGGLEITLDLPAMKAELTRVQAKCAIRGLVQVNLPSSLNFWLKSAWIQTFFFVKLLEGLLKKWIILCQM